jgi:phenylacetate-coenzyme A ligase PaaK-like adenylate-forming protein
MDERYWDPRLETLPTERRRLLQDHRLRWQVRRCWDGSPFYRARLEAAGLDPATFGGLADLARIPILRREDMPTGAHPDDAVDAWAVAPKPWRQDVESFEGGLRRVLTDGDVTHRAHLAARALWAAGVRPGRSLSAMAGQHPSSNALMVENVAPVAAYACGETAGFHWSDDHFLVEIVDPAGQQAVESGGTGALVITDLVREGSPLIRFWTGLEASLTTEPCPCGRTSARSTVVRPLTRG